MKTDDIRDLKQTGIGVVGVAALAVIFACAGAQRVIWPTAVACGPQIAEAIADVTGILIGAGDDWRAGLEEVAKKKGADAVLCAAERVHREWQQPGALHDPRVLKADGRAAEFLKDVQVSR